jgi:GIY-YIG catalytic domain
LASPAIVPAVIKGNKGSSPKSFHRLGLARLRGASAFHLRNIGSWSQANGFVYLLRSVNMPKEAYIGLTSDVRIRLDAHNAGRSGHRAVSTVGRWWRRSYWPTKLAGAGIHEYALATLTGVSAPTGTQRTMMNPIIAVPSAACITVTAISSISASGMSRRAHTYAAGI